MSHWLPYGEQTIMASTGLACDCHRTSKVHQYQPMSPPRHRLCSMLRRARYTGIGISSLGNITELLHLPDGTATPCTMIAEADTLISATPWPEYRGLELKRIAKCMHQLLMLNARKFSGRRFGAS